MKNVTQKIINVDHSITFKEGLLNDIYSVVSWHSIIKSKITHFIADNLEIYAFPIFDEEYINDMFCSHLLWDIEYD